LREHEMRSNPYIISVKIPFDAFIIVYISTCGDKLFEGDFEISWLTGGGGFFILKVEV